jgi:hypothetical protein
MVYRRNCATDNFRDSVCFDTCVVASALDADNARSLIEYAGSRKILVPIEVLMELVAVPEPHLKTRTERLYTFSEMKGVFFPRPFSQLLRREIFGKNHELIHRPEFDKNLRSHLNRIRSESDLRRDFHLAAKESRSDLLEVDRNARIRFKEFDQSELQEKILKFPGTSGLATKPLREIWEIFESIQPSFRKFKMACRGGLSVFQKRYYSLAYMRMMLTGSTSDHPTIVNAKKISRNNWEDVKIATVSWFAEELVTADKPFFDFLELVKVPCLLECRPVYREPT